MITANTTGMDAYELAAETGIAQAQYDLALKYAVGSGVPQDLIAAHKWFNLAAMKGIDEARLHRADLAREMSAGEIAEAQRLAREWAHAH
jgi:TPR repeat protein